MIKLLHDWVLADENLAENSLKCSTIFDRQQHESFENILEQYNGKLLVEIFEPLFNHEIRYASVAHNDSASSIDDLRKFVGVLFLSGFHTLP